MRSYSTRILSLLRVHGKYLAMLYGTFGVYFVRIFQHSLVSKTEGLYAGHPHIWSDWALHISLTNIFALKQPSEWFLYHPYFAGGKLTYGFLTHFISGMLMRLGLSIESASIYPSIALILIFITGLYFVGFVVTQSQKTAALAVFITMLSSGVGGVTFLGELYKNGNIAMLIYPPFDYTRIEAYQWFAGNIPAAILVPQRAFLMGAAIGIWSLYLFYAGLRASRESIQKKLFFFAGCLAGILPIAHMHSFIALVVLSGSVSMLEYKKYKALSWFVIPAASISIPLYVHFVHAGIQISDFFTIQPGFTSQGGFPGWLSMWWELWGLVIPIALASMWLFKKQPNKQQRPSFFAGFFVLFLLANIIMFQPTFWDNSKLFTWVYFGFSILIARYIVQLYETKQVIQRLSMWLLIFLLTFTGFLELIRLQSFDKNTHLLSTTEDMNLAEQVRKKTDPKAIFLTAPIHNHPINMWAARSIFLGYPGWIRNFGFEYYSREQDMRAIYEGQPSASELLKNNAIDFVYVGNQERGLLNVSDVFFERFPILVANDQAVIYDVRSLRQGNSSGNDR